MTAGVPSEESLPLSLELRIEAECTRFEAAWKGAAASGGPQPRIEDYLPAVEEAERWPLLRELLLLDLHYCRGERPTAEEYGRRFPVYAGRIAPLLRRQTPVENGPPKPARGSDRNLLFGMLALQMDFIGRDTLIAAMHDWVLEKTKSLGQILLDEGAIGPDEQGVLEALVQKHLQRHGNDPEQSLAALGAPAGLAQELRNVRDGDLQASLDSVAGAADTGAVATGPYVPASSSAPPEGMRYRVLRPHARGGLGEVFVALDQELHREVALKEILERFADDPQSRGRFLLEAEITGGLEHPGIVPVYGLGCYADGRPFYAMRFIQGDSLQAAIERFHEQDGPGRDPGERSLALRQLLRRFVDVCNALAYAHSRGVLHRDLKPANVMLGKYGETLVVDWGLAKTVGREEGLPGSEERTLRPQSGSGAALTQMGSALGTPGYMSPEQASGRLDLVGRASDVYSLGATLYALLTGKAPFSGSDAGAILDRVRRGQFPRPRQVKPGTPAPLEAICLKAMALEPVGRYGAALSLAADVEHWLADEPVSAWPEPWGARLGRWARRHKPAVAGVAALLVTAVVALALSTAVVMRAERQTEEARRRAANNFQKALDAVERMLTRVGETQLAEVPEMDEARQRLLEDALEFYQGFVQEGNTDPAVRRKVGRAYQRTGRIRELLGKREQAEEDYHHALELQSILAHEFPGDPSTAHDWARSYLALADLCRDQRGRTAEAEVAYKLALEILQPLAATNPDIHGVQDSLATAYNNRGLTYRDTSRFALAKSDLENALAIRSDLDKQHPEVSRYREALADSHESLGELYGSRRMALRSQAEAELKEAIVLREQLAAEHPADHAFQHFLANSYTRLGYHYASSGQEAGAKKPLEDALRIFQQLADDHPMIPEYQTQVAFIHGRLGNVYFLTDGKVTGDEHFRKSVDLFERLIRDSRGQIRVALLFADISETIGVRRREDGDLDGAFPWFGSSIKLAEGVLEKEHQQTEATNRLVTTYMDRAEAFVRSNRRDEAVKDWDEMIKRDNESASALVRMFAAMARAHRGDHARATAVVDQMLKEKVEPANAFYNFPCIYSLASAAAREDETLAAADRTRLAEQYAARSIQLLQQARTDGFFQTPGYVGYLTEDSDFKALRKRDDFQQLLLQLKEDTKAARNGKRQ
jgi:serine/threonine-protein kinase